jgi:salicylate hydroxylase
VYEQAPELKEVGAGLVIAPNAARLLRRLGVLGTFAQRAVRLETGWEFRRWQDGTVLSAEDLDGSCERLYGEHTYTAHRADLLETLKTLIPNGSLRLSARLLSLDPDGSGGAVLRFASGQMTRADVVIGADGIHSVIRGTLASPAPPVYSGLCAFRALVPAEKAPEFAGKLVNLVAFAPAGDYTTESWTATATVGEFLAEFDGWDPRLAALIGAAGTPGRWALLDRAPLTRWSHGRVTLLGDAAHPMFPFFAQGAAQAMEDAAVLARCLAECAADGDSSGWPEALRRYESLRLPRTTRLQKVSHARAHANHLPDGPEQRARDSSFAAADPLVANAWIYSYDPAAGA